MALALFTSTSMPPNFFTAASTAVLIWSSDRTSTTHASARPPAFSISSAAVWIVPASLGWGWSVFAAITTLAPSRAARSPIALPIPRLAPVMKSVLPLRLLDMRAAVYRLGACPSGPSLSATAPSVSATGPSLNATDPAFNATGPSLNATGPSLNATGPSLHAIGPSLNATGASVDSTGPSVNATGAPVDSTGPSVNATGASVDSTDPPVDAMAPAPFDRDGRLRRPAAPLVKQDVAESVGERALEIAVERGRRHAAPR